MPSINDLKVKKTKKFEKKEFRPWDDLPNNEPLPANEGLDIELKNEVKARLETQEAPVVTNNTKTELKDSDKNFTADHLRKLKRRLYGPQKLVLAFLIDNIDFKEESRIFLKPMVYVEVAEELEITLSNLKSILNKFKKDGLISLDDYKPGKGGYGCYVMDESIHSFFSDQNG
jgi:hypothetical protein